MGIPEHWYRFVRQRLHWTTPQLSTPKQMETWSDLMPLMTWQLWLARNVVEDSPLPGAKTHDPINPRTHRKFFRFTFGKDRLTCT